MYVAIILSFVQLVNNGFFHLYLGLLIGLTHGQSGTSNACPPYWVHHGQNCYGVITHLLADWMEAVVCGNKLGSKKKDY